MKSIVTHRALALWVALPLALSALSGMAYRLGRHWFGLSKDSASWLMDLHTGAWLGAWGSSLYLAIVAAGLLTMILTGCILLFKRGSKVPSRMRHRILGAVLMVPLAATAVTGISYKLGVEFFGISDASQRILMQIHQGSWMGRPVTPFYVLLIGSGLLAVLISGLKISPWWRKKARPNHSAVG